MSGSVPALSARQKAKREVARYERSMQRLGCATTVSWVFVGILVLIKAVEVLTSFGLPWVAALALGSAAVAGVRAMTLVLYRAARDRARDRHRAALSRGVEAPDAGHLPAPLSELVAGSRALVDQIQGMNTDPDVVLTELRAWSKAVASLEPQHARRLRELGIDISPLRPLLLLRRAPGQVDDIWNEAAYRRLQSAVPVLEHLDIQLCRHRDDAYR